MERRAALAERRRIRARARLRGVRGLAEQGVCRRRQRRAERREIHDAANLSGLAAERNVLHRAARVFTLRHGERGAKDVCADQLLLNRLAVDLLLQELGEDVCALRVTNQHEAAAAVVALQVRSPRIAYVVVPHSLSKEMVPPDSRCRSPASVSCRYIGAKVRHLDPKRANCW